MSEDRELGHVNPNEIRETANDIGQIAFLLGTYCIKLKEHAEKLEKRTNRLINKISNKRRSTNDEDVYSNTFGYSDPEDDPSVSFMNYGTYKEAKLTYKVGCRLWNFSALAMTDDGKNALKKIKEDYPTELNENLKKIMNQKQIEILQDADAIDASIYAINVRTGGYSENPQNDIKWGDIIFAVGVAGNTAEDEYSAVNGTGGGIDPANQELYNAPLRFRKASEYLSKDNPGRDQDAYAIEKWDGEKWVAMKWVSKKDMQKIIKEYEKQHPNNPPISEETPEETAETSNKPTDEIEEDDTEAWEDEAWEDEDEDVWEDEDEDVWEDEDEDVWEDDEPKTTENTTEPQVTFPDKPTINSFGLSTQLNTVVSKEVVGLPWINDITEGWSEHISKKGDGGYISKTVHSDFGDFKINLFDPNQARDGKYISVTDLEGTVYQFDKDCNLIGKIPK